MIVQDHADSALLGVVLIEILEQQNELSAAVSGMNLGDDFAVVQVHRGENGQGAMALVLMIPAPGAVLPRYGRPIRGGIGNGLNAWLLVHAHGDDRTGVLPAGAGGVLQANFLV